MNLRRNLVLFLLISLASTAFAVTPVTTNTGYYPPGTSIKKIAGASTFAFEEMGANGVSGVSVDPNTGFLAVSTATFDVTQAAKVDIGANLPSGTVGFQLKVFNGDLVINSLTNVATSPFPVGVVVASGSYVQWAGLASGTTKNIYALPVSAASVTCVLSAWGQ